MTEQSKSPVMAAHAALQDLVQSGLIKSQSVSRFLAAFPRTDPLVATPVLKDYLLSAVSFCFGMMSGNPSIGLRTQLLHHQEQLLRALLRLDPRFDCAFAHIPELIDVLIAQGKLTEAAAWTQLIALDQSGVEQ